MDNSNNSNLPKNPKTPDTDSPAMDPKTPDTDSPAMDPKTLDADSPAMHPQAPTGYRPAMHPQAPTGYRPPVNPQAPTGYRPAMHPQAPTGYRPAVNPQAPTGYGPAMNPQVPNGYPTPNGQQAPNYYQITNKKMKACKTCGVAIAKNAKSCPSCGAKNKKPIFKRVWFWLICIIAIIVVANRIISPNIVPRSYKTYSVDGVTFELPESWEIEQSSEGYLTSKNLNNSSFCVIKYKTNFSFYEDIKIIPVLLKAHGVTVKQYGPNQYGSHQAYDYVAKAVIQGNEEPAKVNAIQGDNSVVVIVLIYADEKYDYENIYSHLLSSIK